MANDFYRGRRLRQTKALRELIHDVRLNASDLMMPYFVIEGVDEDYCNPICSMPGQFQLGLKALEDKVEKAIQHGLHSIMLFGLPKEKDPIGSGAYDDNGIIQIATRRLKAKFPELIIATDVCLCEYTSHGHCGILKQNDESGAVLNDQTLDLLNKVAISHAKAGADIIAPSDMMDGRIQSIRKALDDNGFYELPIMSYAVKFASNFYGPFRDAADSAPQFGDRRTYQMDNGAIWQCLREARADIEEGADIIMVKPAGAYLDIIKTVHDNFDAPIAAYQVSGEYAMIKAAAQNGWINEDAIVIESLQAIRRAGAKIIINYFTEDLLVRGLVK